MRLSFKTTLLDGLGLLTLFFLPAFDGKPARQHLLGQYGGQYTGVCCRHCTGQGAADRGMGWGAGYGAGM